MNENNKGNGLIEVLLIVFIVLKLCGVITWPWLWVLSPLWISLIVYIVALIIVLLVKALK